MEIALGRDFLAAANARLQFSAPEVTNLSGEPDALLQAA